MTATIVSNTAPFGLMSNQLVADLFSVNQQVIRLQAAITNAAAAYSGTAGTEYEGSGSTFGVVASATPGAKGADYAYAVDIIASSWNTFWSASIGALEAIDNGVKS